MTPAAWSRQAAVDKFMQTQVCADVVAPDLTAALRRALEEMPEPDARTLLDKPHTLLVQVDGNGAGMGSWYFPTGTPVGGVVACVTLHHFALDFRRLPYAVHHELAHCLVEFRLGRKLTEQDLRESELQACLQMITWGFGANVVETLQRLQARAGAGEQPRTKAWGYALGHRAEIYQAAREAGVRW